MNFENVSAATDFINAIRHVCPCKENSASAQPPARTMTMQTSNLASSCQPSSSQPQSVVRPFNQPTGPASRRTFMKPTSTFRRTVTKLPAPASQNSNTQFILPKPPVVPQHVVDWDSLPVPSIPTPSDDRFDNQATTQPQSSILVTNELDLRHPRPSDDDEFSATDSRPSSRRRLWESDDPLPPSSLPDLTPPSSDTAVTTNDMSSQAVDESRAQKISEPSTGLDPQNSLLSSLQDSLNIYNMPKVELEALVAQIVREDQFAKLVSNFTLLCVGLTKPTGQA